MNSAEKYQYLDFILTRATKHSILDHLEPGSFTDENIVDAVKSIFTSMVAEKTHAIEAEMEAKYRANLVARLLD